MIMEPKFVRVERDTLIGVIGNVIEVYFGIPGELNIRLLGSTNEEFDATLKGGEATNFWNWAADPVRCTDLTNSEHTYHRPAKWSRTEQRWA